MTNKPFKPLLAGKMKDDSDYEKIRFPVITTPKLDGIRILKKDGQLWTRSLKKPVPNKYIQSMADLIPDNLDGEIITYHDPQMTQMKKLNEIASDVMSADGEPYWLFHAFDDFSIPSLPYEQRIVSLWTKIEGNGLIKFVPPVWARSIDALKGIHAENVGNGWEGTMYRYPMNSYKFGRSTFKEGTLVKIKDFLDDEAVIIGIEELYHNENEPIENALGLQERSSHKDNLVPAGMMGALVCRWDKGPDFKVGTGFDMELRKKIWDNQEYFIGKQITFKYQAILKDKPEFPVFIAFREIGT